MLTLKGETCYEKNEKDLEVAEHAYGSFQRGFTPPETIDARRLPPMW